jgi:dTDP-4-amino-4,6-dideoxygalactose transaminase
MIPFSPPYMDADIINAVVETLKSGWITTGPHKKRFEEELEKYCNSSKILCLSSGTAGLEMILRWYGIRKGDEVIIPAYTYCATAHAVIHCGARPLMVDIGDDFNINPEEIEKKIHPATKAIIPVDIGGWPCDYPTIHALVLRDDIQGLFQADHPKQEQLGRILVLSDAAHSFGAGLMGKKSGVLSDISVFSFHAVKNLTTGEGGAISFALPEIFDLDEEYKTLNIMSLHGQSKDAFSKTMAGSWKYDVLNEGYKCNMPDLLAVIGLEQLKKYDDLILPKRKAVFESYNALLKNKEWAVLPQFSDSYRASSFHVYNLRIKHFEEKDRDDLIAFLAERKISANVHFQPLPMLTYFKNAGYNMEDYPKSYEAYSKEISLPVFHQLREEQIEYIAESIIKFVES